MTQKNAIEEVKDDSPGFYNRLFLVLKASGTWRPVLDVSRLNNFVIKTKFSMETTQSVLNSIQRGDWMISMDMRDAYFHIPIHPTSRKFLRFSFNSKTYQFRALCFGLSTAPQVFTRVLAPLAKILHLAGFRILLYLDDWLVIARSREGVLRAKTFVLNLALELGILINHEKSCLVPTQVIEYLGMEIDSLRFWVSPTTKRTDSALSTLREFLSSVEKPARSWQSLLGFLSSLEKFIPGARLRMRPLQFHLNRTWDRVSQHTLIPIPPNLKEFLSWWADPERITKGLSLTKNSPDLQLFSDASREGWGATIENHHLSGKWSPSEKRGHINTLELKAIWLALREVLPLVRGKTVAVFSDNTTALSYILKRGNQVLDAVSLSTRDFSLAGGTPHLSNSPVYPRLQEYSSGFSEQERAGPSHRVDTACGRLPEDLDMVGSSDGGSICHQSDKETPTIHVSSLRPIGNSDGRHVAKLVQRGRLCVPSIRHDKECDQQVSTESQLQTDPNSTMVASEGMVPRSTESSDGTTKVSATQTGPSEPTTSKGKAQKSPHASTNRMETMLRLMKHKDLSSKVSRSIYDSRKSSTNVLYQKRWATFVSWCRANKYSASRPTITSLCEFFIYLFEEKGLVVNTIRCYRSTLHSVLRHTGLKINKNQDVADVIRSLRLRAPVNNSRLVNWNLDVLLKFLCSDTFEPISHCSLLNLTRKTFILLALALSKRVSELQALSRTVGFCTEGALVSLSLDFRAKNDFKCKDLERHFLIKELGSLVGQEEEALLCPVRALKTYLERTNNLVGPNMGRLFVSPRKPTNPASKNALTSMTKDVIREAHVTLRPDLLPILKVKTHELRGVSTTMAFNKNLSLQAVMEAAQWRCNSVFASHYLKDIALTYEDCRTLGPLLVAGTVIT